VSVFIDERAIIGKNVELGEGVKIAPFAVIEENVVIGAGSTIGSHSLIGSNTTLGKDCRVFNGVSVGTVAQDLKYRDEDAFLTIGDRAIIREFCTVNKGTEENNGITKIGDDAALLAYCHVAHDCEIGNNFIASNNLALAGHVIIGDSVTCGGFASVHQFVRVGSHTFLGAHSFSNMDVVPFSLVASDGGTGYVTGLNKVGLERRGFTKDDLSVLKKAYKFLFRKGLSLDEAKSSISSQLGNNKHLLDLLSFVEKSERGLLRMKS
jgi:UDP-N-acetylglucosamine acyltransferase